MGMKEPAIRKFEGLIPEGVKKRLRTLKQHIMEVLRK